MEFSVLQKALKSKSSSFNQARVQRAYEIAAEVHKNQKRLSGEPYIKHPVEVACLIAQFGGDEDMICAALLHDVLEDGDNPEALAQTIIQEFGKYVFFMVDALSKDTQNTSSHDRHNQFVNQLKSAFDQDIGVFFIKLADLLHNLQSIEYLKPEKQKKWLRELHEDYLPLLSEYFHKISFRYHSMYLDIMDEFEAVAAHKI